MCSNLFHCHTVTYFWYWHLIFYFRSRFIARPMCCMCFVLSLLNSTFRFADVGFEFNFNRNMWRRDKISNLLFSEENLASSISKSRYHWFVFRDILSSSIYSQAMCRGYTRCSDVGSVDVINSKGHTRQGCYHLIYLSALGPIKSSDICLIEHRGIIIAYRVKGRETFDSWQQVARAIIDICNVHLYYI